MRSSSRVLLLLLISVTFVAAIIESNGKPLKIKPELEISRESEAKEEDFERASISIIGTSENDVEPNEESNEFFSVSKADIESAWKVANKLYNRNPAIWRKDKKDNIILYGDYTISSPLAYRALVKPADNGGASVSFEPVQQEYYGEGDEDNHANALKYKAKDQEQDDFLSLIEIALNGNVSDDYGKSYCWVPSIIHQVLFLRHDDARRWHMNLFNKDFKYGMAGHNLAFQHMGIVLKDIRRIPEKILNSLDQINDLVYIHNYQSQCSDVIGQIMYVEDPNKLNEKRKNNWGLPKVDDFIDPETIINNSAVMAKAKIGSPLNGSIAGNKVKIATKSVLNDHEWPSLQMPTAAGKSKLTKKKKPSSAI